jgi:hypothetical protein
MLHRLERLVKHGAFAARGKQQAGKSGLLFEQILQDTDVVGRRLALRERSFDGLAGVDDASVPDQLRDEKWFIPYRTCHIERGAARSECIIVFA